MRLLLLSGLIHYPHLSGANKGNRILMEALACSGHHCRVVCPATSVPMPATRSQLHAQLATAGVPLIESSPFHVHYRLRGVDVFAIPDRSKSRIHLRAAARRHIETFEPDWVLVASEDLGQVLLRQALRDAPSRVIYLAQTTAFLPCGPGCPTPDPERTELLQRAAGVVSISHFLARYLRDFAGVDSAVFPYLAMAEGPFSDLGSFEAGAVTMVNPCLVKGLPIFLDLARRLPDVSFAAVPTWGVTPESVHVLEGEPNVRLLEPSENIDTVLRETRVLLVPSLWLEAFGAIALEAMLRGIPVVASRVGGLPEAKRDVEYLLPVRPIEYHPTTHEMVVPSQNLKPWEETLRSLTSDRGDYERVADASRHAARSWVETLTIESADACLRAIAAGGSHESRA